MQAQDFAGAAWAVAQRCACPSTTAFQACFDAGEILRTHVLRPTWHLVAPEDLRPLLALSAPRVHAVNGPYYRREGVDADLAARVMDLLREALAGGGAVTRAEAGQLLNRHGIDTGGLRATLLLMWAELEAVVCSGPMRGKQHTLALVSERVPAGGSGTWSLDELARRYLVGRAPATAADFAWWSGSRLSDARQAIAAAGSPQPASGGRAPVTLLPNFDEYFVGYAEPSRSGIAIDRPAVLIEGRHAGYWRRSLVGKQVSVTVELFEAPSERTVTALHDAATAYADFLQRPLQLTVDM